MRAAKLQFLPERNQFLARHAGQDPKLAGDQNFLAVYSQGKNPGWTSQRWVIN